MKHFYSTRPKIQLVNMSIAEQVKEYIDSKPSIKSCLKLDLINFSSLSRLIAEENHLDKKSSFDAILVAIRRAQERTKVSPDHDSRIRKILRDSKLEIKTGICICVLSSKISDSGLAKLLEKIKDEGENYHLIQGSQTITIYTSSQFMKKIESTFSPYLLYSKKSLVQINLRTSDEIMKAQGVMGFVFSLLGENNINVVDCITSWTDNILIIEEKDVAKSISLLKFE